MSISRQKIVIIPAWYPYPERPINGIFIHDQAQCLATRHDVTVIFPQHADHPKVGIVEEVIDGVRILRSHKVQSRYWEKLVPRVFRPSSTERYYQQSWSDTRDAFEHYVAVHGRPDVIHAHIVLPSGWIAKQLASEWKVPVVLTEHTGPFTCILGTIFQRKLALETLLGVDRLLAVSPALAGVIETCFPEVKPAVLGNVVRSDFFSPALMKPNAKFRFFSLAQMVEEKGIQHLLEAGAILRANGIVDFEIILGGDGPCRPMFEQLANSLGIRTSCQFLGTLTRTQARDQMRQCDAFVLPSLRETFCLVLCEAMACGKPVISTRCGGPEFTVDANSGILVSVARPYELADTMAGFLGRAYTFDASTIRQSVVMRFGVDVFINQLEIVYNQIQEKVNWTTKAA
jgi:glycosyltransferase involved in cell wall biosynthesis